MHQIAVGPVHAGIIEPGHFRFTASGETVVTVNSATYLNPRNTDRRLVDTFTSAVLGTSVP